MRPQIHYRVQHPILELEDEYKRRYAGSEADIRFDSYRNSMLGFDVRIDVPHLIAVDDKLMEAFGRVAHRCSTELMYECLKIASAMRHESKEAACVSTSQAK